jgi:hypothetical protein
MNVQVVKCLCETIWLCCDKLFCDRAANAVNCLILCLFEWFSMPIFLSYTSIIVCREKGTPKTK